MVVAVSPRLACRAAGMCHRYYALITTDGSALNDLLYSMFLTAYTTGRTVNITGTGTCTDMANVENINAASIAP